VTSGFVSFFQHLDIGCVARTAVSVIPSLRLNEFFILLHLVLGRLLRKVCEHSLLISLDYILLTLNLCVVTLNLALVISFLQLSEIGLAL
jgi:hypothetical protein